MANTSDDQKVSLKLLIDQKTKKVLFAEAGKDFVDFLFHLLTLPLATVTSLLSKKSMVGCLGNLYGSVENLNRSYVQPNQTKDSILKPNRSFYSSSLRLLSLNDSPTSKNMHSFGSFYGDSGATCRNCGNREGKVFGFGFGPSTAGASPFAPSPVVVADSSSGEGGFVKGVVTYMVTDDLVVTPMSTISSITLLNKFNVQDVSTLEEKTIELGMDQVRRHRCPDRVWSVRVLENG